MKLQVLLKKYESLVQEWNMISLVVAICFSSALIGLAIGLISYNLVTICVMFVVMICFGVFEYKVRKRYVDTKAKLEKEIFKLAKLKRLELKEIVKKGLWG